MMSKDLTEFDLVQVNEQINDWYGFFAENLTAGQQDREFLFRSQWDTREKKINEELGKAQLTFNKLYDYYRKAIAQQRKNTVNIVLRANDSAKSVDQSTIDLHAGLLRSVAYGTKSNLAYQTAFATALHSSFGALRVDYDYVNGKSFEQEIKIIGYEDPERCFWDPKARNPTKDDGDYCGVYTTYSRAYFEKLYPNVDISGIRPMQSWGTKYFSWGTNKTVTVVELYQKEYYEERIYQLANGEVLNRSELNQLREMLAEAEAEGISDDILGRLRSESEVVDKRTATNYRIKKYLLTQKEIIGKPVDWPSKYFPIVYVDGDSYWDSDKQYTQTLIRHARDAQRFLNYCAIEIATALKNSRKETFLVTARHTEGYEDIWRAPEKQHSGLLYNYDPEAGPPIKVPPTELSPSLLQQYQRAELDLQSILGVYEAARGAASNERTGVAINRRSKNAQDGLYVFFDNLNTAVEQIGRVCLDLLPIVYDTERPVMVTMPDGQSKSVVVNQYDPITETFHNKIEGYEWQLEVSAGSSFDVQRMESLEQLITVTQVNPQVFPLVADKIAENLDLRNTPQLVERFRNLVPKDIIAKEQGLPPPPPPPPSPEEQMMQMEKEFMQQKTQLEYAKLQAQVKREEEKTVLEHEKIKTQEVKNQVDMLKAMTELHELPIQAEVAEIRARAEIEKADRELEGDMVKAYVDTVKHMSQLQKHVTDTKTRESKDRS